MNIGDTVKLIKKDYPSVTISRIRFLEKEGLIKPKRSKGGTRSFTDKDIIKIKNFSPCYTGLGIFCPLLNGIIRPIMITNNY